MLSLLAVIFAQAIVIVYPGVLIFWLVLHTRIEHWRRVGKRAYWIASLGWPLTAGPLIYFRAQVFSLRWPLAGTILRPAGLAALLAGLFVAAAAAKQIPLRTLVGLPELQPQKNSQQVLDTGVYSKVRNPIYLSHWLILASAAALSGFAANGILLALDCIVLPVVIRLEERELLARCGPQFAAYMRRVPRFVPNMR